MPLDNFPHGSLMAMVMPDLGQERKNAQVLNADMKIGVRASLDL